MLYKFLLAFIILLNSHFAFSKETITVGSKRFTESYILAEIMSQLLEDRGFIVERKFGLGGTLIAFDALRTGAIHTYPEYSGTLAEAIFKVKETSLPQLKKMLNKTNLDLLDPFGFNNTYAIVMRKDFAHENNIQNISSLKNHPNLLGAFSGEFQKRSDGWNELKNIYNLSNSIRTIEIPLSYEALHNKKVDFSEAYSTEPLIKKYDFVILEDNLNFFPKYEAIPLIQKNLPTQAQSTLLEMKNLIDNNVMTSLNEKAAEGESFEKIAQDFLISNQLVKNSNTHHTRGFNWSKLITRTKTHLLLTCLAVLLAALIAIPLATWISDKPKLAQPILTFTGLLQTIPSIALLTFMIPLVGIGFKPALLGLFIYSLLPIVRNTYVAMNSIDPRIVLAAQGIGLYPREIFFSVKLPLSLPMILAGIRTATILNIGTATLAAFIGAGGLGEPIVMGLALNDTKIILEGAIPAAILAIIMDFFFSFLEKVFNKNL